MYNNNRVFNTRYYSTYGHYDSPTKFKCPFTTGPGQDIIKPVIIDGMENGAFQTTQIVNPNTLSNAYPMSCLDSTYLIPLVPNQPLGNPFPNM